MQGLETYINRMRKIICKMPETRGKFVPRKLVKFSFLKIKDSLKMHDSTSRHCSPNFETNILLS